MSVEVDKICRTCLGLTGPLLSIYDGDANNCVAEMLRDFTRMKPTPTDNMPSKVCLTCISEINRCYSFKMKCENSNRTLRQLIPDAVPEEQTILASPKMAELLNKSSQTFLSLKVEQKSVEIQTIEQATPCAAATELKTWKAIPKNKANSEINTIYEKENTFVNNETDNNVFTYERSSISESAPPANEAILPDATSLNTVEDSFDSYEIECMEEGNEYVVEVKHVADINERMPVELNNMLVTPSKNQPPKDGAAVYEITNANNRTEIEVQSFEPAAEESATLEDESFVQDANEKIVNVFYDAKRKRNEYKCSECTQTFVSLNVLRRHLTKIHDLYVSEEVTEKTAKSNEAESPTNLSEFLNVPERTHFCRQCNASFVTKRSLLIHKKKNVCNLQCHKCATCDRVFETTEQLESHVTNDHVAKVIECIDCNQSFKNQEELSRHQVSKHKRSLQNQCNICKKVFTMMSTLKDHLRIHTGEKPFQCTVCGKAFSQKSNLKQHMQRHEKTKVFKCTDCEDSFVTRSELFSHQRKHTGAQPYKCDFCSASFSTNSTLNKHRRQHTGERPYACDVCPMRFSALNVLKNHRRIHTGEKPYSCPICKKKFIQQGDCTVHMKTHDGAKTHNCLCGKQFPIPSRLIKHQKACKFIKKEVDDDEDDAQKSSDELIEMNLAKMCDD